MKNLDLETLEYVKIAFDIHSDLSTKTNGYKWICKAIDECKKQKISEPTTKKETSKANLNITGVSKVKRMVCVQNEKTCRFLIPSTNECDYIWQCGFQQTDC